MKYSVKDDKFVPIKYNIVTGPTTRYMKIEKDALGTDKPVADFYITSGHKLVIDGKEIKAGKIPQAKRVKVKPELVYSICTDQRQIILVNGLSVIALGFEEWDEYSKKRNIIWNDNYLK